MVCAYDFQNAYDFQKLRDIIAYSNNSTNCNFIILNYLLKPNF